MTLREIHLDNGRHVRVIVGPELVDIKAAAAALGVTSQAVSNYLARHDDFPAPVVDIPRHRLWHLPDVLAWHEEHKRGPAYRRQRERAELERLRAEVAELERLRAEVEELRGQLTDD